MKMMIQWGIIGVIIAGFMTTGFQCSSAELTGAKLYIQQKNYQKAEDQLIRETQKNPRSEEAFFLLGQVRLELRNYVGMREAWENALKISQAHKKEISNQLLYTWGKKFNEGVEAINSSEEKPELLDKAIEAFNLSVTIMPESLATHRNLGLAYLKKGEIENAAHHFTISFEKGKDVMACRRLGRIYQDSAIILQMKFDGTNKPILEVKRKVEAIRSGIKVDDVKYMLGEPSKVNKPAKPKKGDTKEEWEYTDYNLIIAIETGFAKTVTFSKPYEPAIDSTAKYASIALYNKAIEVYKRGQVLFPEDAEMSENLMNAFIGAERTVEARALLDERVRKYPDSKFDRYNLGVFQLKDGKYESAIEQFIAALKLDTNFSAATYNIAACYVNWGVAEQERVKQTNEKLRAENKKEDLSYKEKYRSAVPWLEKVLQSKTDDVQMWELLGQVYANLNEQQKAADAYKKADEIRASRK
ncbi:MAG: tetratricopeptide repeat protein [Ignavibacteriales bacterium]|nr:tetratricopeptide repeat protein [Ignavibacteriales bacterium]